MEWFVMKLKVSNSQVYRQTLLDSQKQNRYEFRVEQGRVKPEKVVTTSKSSEFSSDLSSVGFPMPIHHGGSSLLCVQLLDLDSHAGELGRQRASTLYGALQVVLAVTHYAGLLERMTVGEAWVRNLVAAMCSFSLSGFRHIVAWHRDSFELAQLQERLNLSQIPHNGGLAWRLCPCERHERYLDKKRDRRHEFHERKIRTGQGLCSEITTVWLCVKDDCW